MLDIAFVIICFIVFAFCMVMLLKAVWNCGKAEGIKTGVELCTQEIERTEIMVPDKPIPMEHEHGE